jgi:diguanylate cyclase (GGDEF)-like protein/PAS domain S-box-containing protein
VTRTDSPLLIVDDNQLSREVFRRSLEGSGYNVVTADNGREALDRIAARLPALVLLDVTMPEMDGLEVLQAIRRSYSAVQLPVIMVTGLAASPDVVRALELGASDYLTKPIDFPVALARIRTQLSIKRAEEALSESEERYALAARGANDGLWDWDLRRDQISYSPRWKVMIGFEEDEEIGDRIDAWYRRVHPQDLELLKQAMEAHLDGDTDHYESEYRMRHRDGSYRWMLGRGIAVRSPDGRAYRFAGSQTDITRGKVSDPLTGMPNRLLFMDNLGRCFERSRRHPEYGFALIFLDVDSFKLINDSMGHVVGDQLLIAIARRLEASLRSEDMVSYFGCECTVARLGGDEFTILVENITSPAVATTIAERIRSELGRVFILAGHEVFSSASMGIALSNGHYEHPEELLRDADTAMYQAKGRGKAQYEVFNAEMRASAVERLEIETDLRRAVESEQFLLHYQAIVDLASGEITGFEGLLRWRHPERGLLVPAEFINIAEETGVISQIGLWGLRQACAQVRRWQQAFPGPRPLQLHANLSSRDFIVPDLDEQILAILEETGLDPWTVNLEITEGVLMPEPALAIGMMKRLKERKLRLSMDDFGTGYSSLSYLHRFPLDSLKIDRSFVSRLAAIEQDGEIVRSILSLGHNLGLEVIAEGVETNEQLTILRALGCELGQGYLLSRPLPAENAEMLLTSRILVAR